MYCFEFSSKHYLTTEERVSAIETVCAEFRDEFGEEMTESVAVKFYCDGPKALNQFTITLTTESEFDFYQTNKHRFDSVIKTLNEQIKEVLSLK